GVRLVGVEGGGRGPGRGEHAATMTRGRVGAIHGFVSLVLRDDDGGTPPTHSISAGLDYPGVGPEHALLAHVGRAEYVAATDDEAVEAFDALCRLEGIVPALESAHALAGARRLARENPGAALLVNLSGRGDKDLPQLAARRGAGSR
ncbi:MAG: tryptophan synthase subunit beta, partial [Candidatus Polarisedimenticolia bacterium]